MDLMSKLEGSALEELRQDFRKHDEGLNLEEFTEAMLKGIRASSSAFAKETKVANLQKLADTDSEDRHMVTQLCELFEKIDRNGNGTVSWDEWTSYCVEAGLVATRVIIEPIQYTYTEDIRYRDKYTKSVYVSKLKYVKPLKCIISLEAKSPVVKFLSTGPEPGGIDSEKGSKRPLELKYSLNVLDRPKSSREKTQTDDTRLKVKVMNVLTIKSTITKRIGPNRRAKAHINLLVTLSSNLSMSFWDLSNFHSQDESVISFVKSINTRTLQTSLAWTNGKKYLYTAGSNEYIDYYELGTYSKLGTIESGHGAAITDLLVIDGLPHEVLISGSIDKTIRIFDLRTHRLTAVLRGHSRGLRKIIYSKEHDILLSAGIERTAYAWDITSKKYILRLKGHRKTIVSISLIQPEEVNGKERAITLDVEGNFFVWDITRGASQSGIAPCLLKFNRHNSPKVLFKPYCFCVSDKPNIQIVAAEAKICRFTALKSSKEDEVPLCAMFNKTSLSFITSAGGNIYIWDGHSGKLLEKFYSVIKGEQTVMCLDSRERKFILGNDLGHVQVFNYMNGCLMKDSQFKHKREVSGLCYVDADKLLISVGRDCSVCIHEEFEESDLPCVRLLTNAHKKDISGVAYSDALGVIATTSVDSTVKIWSFEFLKLQGCITGFTESEITAISFLKSYNLLAVSCSNGIIYIIYLHQQRSSEIVCIIKNEDSCELAKKSKENPVAEFESEEADEGKVKEEEKEDNSNKKEEEAQNQNVEKCERETETFITNNIPTLKQKSSSGKASLNHKLKLVGITSLSVGEKPGISELVLYAGDEKGRVKSWDIMPVVQELNIEPQPIKDYPRNKPGYNSRRRITKDMTSSEDDIIKSICFGDLIQVELLDCWQGHEDSIRSVKYIDSPASVVTASFDYSVHVHKLEGEIQGVMNMSEAETAEIFSGKKKPVPWKFDTTFPFKSNQDNQKKQADNVFSRILAVGDDHSTKKNKSWFDTKQGYERSHVIESKHSSSSKPVQMFLAHESKHVSEQVSLRSSILNQMIQDDDNLRTQSDINQNQNTTETNRQENKYQNMQLYLNRHSRNRISAKSKVKLNSKPSDFLRKELELGSFDSLKERKKSLIKHKNRFCRRNRNKKLAPLLSQVQCFNDIGSLFTFEDNGLQESSADDEEPGEILRPHTSPSLMKLQSLYSTKEHKKFFNSIEEELVLSDRPATVDEALIRSTNKPRFDTCSLKARSKQIASNFDQLMEKEDKESEEMLQLLHYRHTSRSRSIFENSRRKQRNKNFKYKQPNNTANQYKSKKDNTTADRYVSKTSRKNAYSIGSYHVSYIVAMYHLFKGFDKDGNGDIDVDEFLKSNQLCKSVNASELRSMFATIDKDESNSITLRELFEVTFRRASSLEIDAMMSFIQELEADKERREKEAERSLIKLTREDHEEIRDIFRFLDVDKNGTIDMEEFMGLATSEGFVTKHDLKVYFDKYDVDNTKSLDIDEFTKLYKEYFTSNLQEKALNMIT